MMELFVRYVHFLGIFALVSALVVEHLLIKSELSLAEVKRLAAIDGIFGFSALLVLGAGLTLWLWVGKPAEFYTANPMFHAKLTAFIVLGLLSIYPTLFLLKSRRKGLAITQVPKKIIMFVRAELLLVLIIPLLAVLMARGHGL